MRRRYSARAAPAAPCGFPCGFRPGCRRHDAQQAPPDGHRGSRPPAIPDPVVGRSTPPPAQVRRHTDNAAPWAVYAPRDSCLFP